MAEGLTIAALQAAHVARQDEWCPDQKPDLSFRGNEMAGEVGEACNVIKKLERERHGWCGSRATIDELGDELADVVHTALLCAITAGITDLEARVIAKFNATSEKNALATRVEAPQSPWRAIREADREVATIQTFGDVTLRNSHPAWVRDADGRTYEAVWTVDDKGRGYWWDMEGEDPVDPIEIYPHPLTRKIEDDLRCDICGGTIRIGDLCANETEMGMVHAECLAGSPVVDDAGEEIDVPLHTYRWEGDR